MCANDHWMKSGVTLSMWRIVSACITLFLPPALSVVAVTFLKQTKKIALEIALSRFVGDVCGRRVLSSVRNVNYF